MNKCFPYLLIFSIFLFTCSETKNPSTENMVAELNLKKEEKPMIEPVQIDSIPKEVFQKISKIPFVKKRFQKLKEGEFRYYFSVNYESSYYPDKYHLQILIDTEFRAIPILNFYYQPKTKELFFLEIIENEDVLILME